MKKLLLICIVATLLACKEDPKIDYVSFSGKIENSNDKAIKIYKGNKIIKEITLKEDFSFTDTLKIENGYYTLNHGRENSTMYLTKGDVIEMTLDTKEFDETISYSGKGAENNNYLASKLLLNEKANLDYAKVFAMEESEFLAKMKEVKNSKKELLKDAKNISDEFRATENKNIEYEYLNDLQNYKNYHAYYAKKEDYKPSENFVKIIEAVDYNNPKDYTQLDSYKRLVLGYYSNKIHDSDNPTLVFEDLNKTVSPTLKKDLAKELRYDIAPNNKHNEAYYNALLSMAPDEEFKKEITKKYNKVKTLAKGMPSPKFVDYENHKGGTTSLEDFKGKYVYVDVWATWCGPCIREIPSLKEVEKQFHDKNIAFVSISIDKASAHDKWYDMVKKETLGGVQLMADNDWSSQFVKDYDRSRGQYRQFRCTKTIRS